MGKYKTTRDCIHAVNGAKDPHDLKMILKKFYPDAFINWDTPVCHIGDVLSRIYNGKKSRYMVIRTVDYKVCLLNLANGQLWTNFSTTPCDAYSNVSRKAFSEITSMTIDKFKIERRK